jgi:hypothetical protein
VYPNNCDILYYVHYQIKPPNTEYRKFTSVGKKTTGLFDNVTPTKQRSLLFWTQWTMFFCSFWPDHLVIYTFFSEVSLFKLLSDVSVGSIIMLHIITSPLWKGKFLNVRVNKFVNIKRLSPQTIEQKTKVKNKKWPRHTGFEIHIFACDSLRK